MFSEFGTVKVVRICTKDSKGRLPTWLSLGCMNPNSHHAYVEFNEEHEAVKAASASYLSLSSPGKDQNTRVKVHLLTDRLEYLANNPEPILSPSSSPTPATLPLAPAAMSRWNSSGGMVASSRSSRDASPNASRWGGQASSGGSLMPRSSVDHVANIPQRKVTGLPPHPFVESQRWQRRTSPSVPIPGPLSLGMEGAAQPRVVGFTHGGILTTENENEGEALLSKTSSRDEERERSSWGSDRPSFSTKGAPNQQEAYVPPSRRSREGSPCLSPAPALSPLAQPFTLESLAASINAAGSPVTNPNPNPNPNPPTAGSPYSPVTAFHAMSPTPPPPSSINQETNSRVALSAMISQIMGSAKDDAAEVRGKKKPPNHDDARRVSHRDDASDDILVNQASDLIGRLLLGIPPVVSSGANGAAMKPPLSRRTQDDGGLATRDLNNARRSTVHVLKPAPASSEAVMITTRGSDSERQDSSLLTSSYYPTSSDQFSRHSSTICSEASGTFNSYGASEEGEAEDDDEEYGAGAGGGLKKKRTRRSKRGRKTVDLVNVQATAPAPSAVNASAGNRRMTTGCVSGAEKTAPLVTLPPTFPGVVAKKDYASWAPATTPHVPVAPAYVVSKGPDGTRGFAGRNRTVS